MPDFILRPSAPGFYSQWPLISGAPSAWEAVRNVDAAYIQSGNIGLRHSFALDRPPIDPKDEILNATMTAYLWRGTDSASFSDGGFEQGETFWTLTDFGCDFSGASINTDLTYVRSGAQSVKLTSFVDIDGFSTCAAAEQVLTGLTVGRQYQVRGYFKTQNIVAQQFQVMRDNTVLANIGSSSPTSFTAFGPVTFTATLSSHTLRFKFQTSGFTARTYYLDDVTFSENPALTGAVTPFWRLGNDVSMAAWSVPGSQTVSTLMPPRFLTNPLAWWFLDPRFEIGVVSGGSPSVRVDQLQLALSVRPFNERFGLVGGRF